LILTSRTLLNGIYDKLINFYSSIYKNEDIEMDNCIYSLKQLNLSHFNVSKEFICDYSDSSLIISNFHQFKSISERMNCLEETMNSIQNKLDEKKNIFDIKENLQITSDELIPILTFIVIQSKLMNLISSLEFTKDYQTSEMQSNQKGFQFTILNQDIVWLPLKQHYN
jgi:cell division protein ZapA (FtsZ GTPase activity inhibitor)